MTDDGCLIHNNDDLGAERSSSLFELQFIGRGLGRAHFHLAFAICGRAVHIADTGFNGELIKAADLPGESGGSAQGDA